MIIFDLDGTLTNCEHRRHFVDPKKNTNYFLSDQITAYDKKFDVKKYKLKSTGKEFIPDWNSFYEACDKDTPINATLDILRSLWIEGADIQIWSGRSESVREKTELWLLNHIILGFELPPLRMRPVGDSTPYDLLKEQWLNQRCSDLIEAQMEGRIPKKHDIDFVFDDRPKGIKMWRSRGIFVFDCNQIGEDF